MVYRLIYSLMLIPFGTPGQKARNPKFLPGNIVWLLGW